jgi:hypothetical protein
MATATGLSARPTPGANGAGDRSAVRVRLRHRRGFLIGVVVCLLALIAVMEVRLFIAPPTGSAPHPQAVIVLGGYGDRPQRGIALAHAEHIPTVAFSTGAPNQCPTHYEGLAVKCFYPQPVSTQGEARAITALAHQNHWTRLLVVAGTTQVARAELRLGRCFNGQVAVNGVNPPSFARWTFELLYDNAAMVKAVVWQWGC